MEARQDISKILNYKFDNLSLVDEALVADGARVKSPENARKHGNKGLALIGDALLRLVMVDDCMVTSDSTGHCQSLCSMELSNVALKKLGDQIGLDKYIVTNAAQGDKVSRVTGASTLEALVGAVWVDCGRDYQCIHQLVHEIGIGLSLEYKAEHSYDTECGKN